MKIFNLKIDVKLRLEPESSPNYYNKISLSKELFHYLTLINLSSI